MTRKINLIIATYAGKYYKFDSVNKDVNKDKEKYLKYNLLLINANMNNLDQITIMRPKVNKEHFELINRIQTLIYYIIVFLLVIGFISYGGEIHDTVRKSKNLTWIDVITDTSICKLENRKNFLHYLKVGLGLKI